MAPGPRTKRAPAPAMARSERPGKDANTRKGAKGTKAEQKEKKEKKKQKKRVAQRVGMRQGKHFKDPESLALLGGLYERLLNVDSLTINGKKYTTVGDMFERLSGVSKSVGKTHSGKKADEIPPPAKPGPKPTSVDEKFEGFYDWVSEKIEGVKKSGFLTLPMLKVALRLERGLTVSLRLLRRTLRKLGFRYVKRVGKWASRRHEERIQRRLFSFLEWVVAHSSREEIEQEEAEAMPPLAGKRKRKAESDGKLYRYVWNLPVGFQDESFVYDAVWRKFSWCGMDKTSDLGKKGDGVRVNMIHCLFSHLCPQPSDGCHPKSLVTWKSSWTGKRHEYSGSTVDGDHILKYFSTRVFPELPGGVVLTDGAGNHKEYTDDMRGMGEEELEEMIQQKCKDASKGSYRWWVWKKFTEKKQEALFPLEAPQLRKFIRDHVLIDTKLWARAQQFSCLLMYLPQYYPECNPIERYWALLKRYYYDTDPKLPHTTRLNEALARIPEDYPSKCIQKSLAWCYAKFAEMKRKKGAGGAEAVEVGDAEQLEDIESEPESDDEE